MRIRNSRSPAIKETPPARKVAAKFPPTSLESVTPKTLVETKRASLGKAMPTNCFNATPLQSSTSRDSKSQLSPVGEGKALADAAAMTPVKDAVAADNHSGAKKKPVKKRIPVSGKTVLLQTPNFLEAGTARVEETTIEKVEDVMREEVAIRNVRESARWEHSIMEVKEPVANVAEDTKVEEIGTEENEELVKGDKISVEGDALKHLGNSLKKKEPIIREVTTPYENKKYIYFKKGEEGNFVKQKEPVLVGFSKYHESKEARFQKQKEEVEEDPEEEEEIENIDDREEPKIEHIDEEERMKIELFGEDIHPEEDEYGGYEIFEEYGDQVDYGEHEEEEFAEDDIEEPIVETETLEDEHRELKAVARDRRIKKEHEIFVGGLDRDATGEDVKKVFERIGDIVEVRLHKDFSTNKNKGYAFVKFANKEHAKRALSDMKNPVICGKRCGTAPSEDNDTLFVGNICNTWTKEAIKQKMKDYGVEGFENITLVPDVQREGLSRGFAFVEFSCHVDAMAAYKRLQKPDVVFGHPDRTVKVAFAEPIREPDPQIMAQVKTVFLDGVPPHWHEEQVRELIEGYGEIIRIVLARNMSTAKRKDFGFVDFSTHEAAVACINGLNNTELGDSNSKAKLKARLSNPLPKTQAVKGGMRGGFRIDHGGSGTFSRYGRGFGRGGHNFNWANFQRGRGFFYQRGHGQIGRVGPSEYGFDNRSTEFHGRQFIGQGSRRGSLRSGHYTSGRPRVSAGSSRPNPSRHWHDVPDRADRGRGEHLSYRREPFSPDEDFGRSYMGRQLDNSHLYDDRAHGVKRPYYTMESDHDYVGSSRLRQRLDYNDAAVSFHGSRYQDNYGAGSGVYSDDYYVSDYGPYPSHYGGDHSYGADRSYEADGSYGTDHLYGTDHSYGSDRSYGSGYYY